MKYAHSFNIGGAEISGDAPVYFIADIGANHDGRLSRARELIKLAAEAGADCVKFQHFQAAKIVSAVGFDGLQMAHQRAWDKSVFEVYQDYSINPDWNEELAMCAAQHNVHFMTTPYDLDVLDSIDRLLLAYKIGSGDITYHRLIKAIAKRGKPVFLATGASDLQEVVDAVQVVLAENPKLCLMQCNTNYTGDGSNFDYINLKVIASYAHLWPSLPLGLSDHTPGHSTAVGAVALGARAIEKHFTDDPTRRGPDHAFALNPEAWKAMVVAVEEVELALGDGLKRVERNELESAVVQRRALRAKHDLAPGTVITADDLVALRPCPEGAFTPRSEMWVIGSHVQRGLAGGIKAGEAIYPRDIF